MSEDVLATPEPTTRQGKGLPPEAYEEIPGSDYQPYVPPEADLREFTLRAVIIGVLVGVVFGAANAYLGLKVGLTVSASIPAAVMGVAFFRALKGGTILEGNMVQTVGSAGESLAAGVIFTLPALFIFGMSPSQLLIFTLASLGGLLGVLFMIPLRRYLIRDEHGKLPYPEGTACAEVLAAGDTGGAKARLLFSGLGVGAVYQYFVNNNALSLWRGDPSFRIRGYPKAEFGIDATPELLGAR
jgi:putative OPT family oligopeptide transporter